VSILNHLIASVIYSIKRKWGLGVSGNWRVVELVTTSDRKSMEFKTGVNVNDLVK
jgi:hypothetical protein